jgi:hypothetical protein
VRQPLRKPQKLPLKSSTLLYSTWRVKQAHTQSDILHTENKIHEQLEQV